MPVSSNESGGSESTFETEEDEKENDEELDVALVNLKQRRATCLQCATSSEVAFAVSRLGSLTLFDQLEPLEANKGRSACPWHEPIPYRAVAVAVVSNSRSGIVAVVGLATLRPQKP